MRSTTFQSLTISMLYAFAACIATETTRELTNPCSTRNWEQTHKVGDIWFAGPCCFPGPREPGIIVVLPLFFLLAFVTQTIAGGWRRMTLWHWLLSTAIAAVASVPIHRAIFRPRLGLDTEWIYQFTLEMLPLATIFWMAGRYFSRRREY